MYLLIFLHPQHLDTLAVIVQDLGRMCRYVKQDDPVPSALLGSGLYEILKDNLEKQAVFHGPFILPSDKNGANGKRNINSI